MEDKEFKEHIKEIARLELKNSFTDNLMQTLNSSFIFKYVQTLEEENQQLKDKLKKIEEYIYGHKLFGMRYGKTLYRENLINILSIIKGDEE